MDGKDGDGTIDNPFDGGEGKIDNLFYKFADKENLVWNFYPGTYKTVGVANKNYEQLKKGWKIRGSGIGVTIFKLTDFLEDQHNKKSGFNICFTTWYKNADNVEISNLTIDCNYWELQTNRPNLGLSGIRLYGNNIKVKNVEVKNFSSNRLMGDGVSFEENFIITTGSIASKSYGHLIEGCYVWLPAAVDGYYSAISLMNPSGGYVSGRVLNNVILADSRKQRFGLNLAFTKNCVYEGNEVYGCERCFSNDSGTNENIIIRNNIFEPSWVGLFALSSKDCIFESNIINLYSDGQAAIVIYQDYNTQCSGWLVRGNIIKNKNKKDKNFSFHTNWNGKQASDNLVIKDNVLDLKLLNKIDKTKTVLIGNIYSDGKEVVT